MHSHHSSFVIDICMTIWLYFCSQQQHLLSLLAFANSSLMFIYIICLWFDSIFHISFHACEFLNEIPQRVSLYINICIYFSLYLFFFFFVSVLAHLIFFCNGFLFKGPQLLAHISIQQNHCEVHCSDIILCTFFSSMHCGNEKTQSSEQNTQHTIGNIEN